MRYYLIVMALLMVFVSCSENEKPIDITGEKPAGSSTKYEIGAISEKPLASYVKLPGQLKPFEEVNIYAKLNGFVKQVFADRGAVVKKGQVLVTLEAPEMESQLQASTSKFVQAQENAVASREKYKRLKEAAKEEGAVAPMDLDNTLSRLKADEAIVKAEQSNVASMTNIQSYLTIRAPFDGVIVQRNISTGALVGPGSKTNDQPMFILQYLGKLRLEVFIPEAYVENVDLTRPVSILYNSLPGVQHKGKISRSANTLSSMRSEAIEIDIDNKNQVLKPGMYAEVGIPLISAAKSLLVPNNSIVRSTERQYIIVVKNGKTDLVDVKVGLSTKDSTEVFGNLNVGDKIILHATDEINQGIKIE